MSAIRHLDLFEDFVLILERGTPLDPDMRDTIAQRLVHVCVLHNLLPETTTKGASVPTTKEAAS